MAGTSSRRRPTMADVARAAEVSVMTVSYTYGQPDRVSTAVRTKVQQAANRIGYPGPHPGARSLRRGRTGNLGVILGEHLTYAFNDPQAGRFLTGVADVCANHSIGLMLLPITGAPGDVQRVAEAAVDGFIVWTTADDDPVIDAVAATGVPAVVHGGPQRAGLSFVAIDNLAAAQAVAGETFATARRPAVLSFPMDRARTPATLLGPNPDHATFSVTRQRLQGMRNAWQDLGGHWPDVRVAVCATNSTKEAEEIAAELLTGPDAPDAVAAMSDELGLGVLRAAAHLNRRVPNDLTVSGWDDTSQAGPAGLTTINQSLRDQGIHCANLALGETPDRPYKPHNWTLIKRDSTRRRP